MREDAIGDASEDEPQNGSECEFVRVMLMTTENVARRRNVFGLLRLVDIVGQPFNPKIYECMCVVRGLTLGENLHCTIVIDQYFLHCCRQRWR